MIPVFLFSYLQSQRTQNAAAFSSLSEICGKITFSQLLKQTNQLKSGLALINFSSIQRFKLVRHGILTTGWEERL